ncbi:alpha/beta hydrolase [Ectobacillus funiculus]|uniref:intracellular short-chain-length polyhydroxyalkanoate depolymerase n=1 Tax=Ectobacillus funiculus TaxID=137993 RepID=UPI00397B1D45
MDKLVHLKKVSLANGETLGYRERIGGEENLLLIHGNMTSSKHWDLLIEELDPKYKLYAVDMRGFGISSYHTPIERIKDFSDDIKLFVDEMGLENFGIIGWSTGGAVAMEFCADYPGYCNRLILLSSASTRGYPFFGTDQNGQPNITKRLQTVADIQRDPLRTIPIQRAYDSKDREVLKGIWNALIYRKAQPKPEKYEEYVEDMITQRNLADVYHSLNTFNISMKYNGLTQGSDKVNAITIPVLVLRGDEDLVITDEMTKEILEDFKGRAQYVELTGCGHSPLVDNLKLLTAEVEKFLG